jgi:hypothetical protein
MYWSQIKVIKFQSIHFFRWMALLHALQVEWKNLSWTKKMIRKKMLLLFSMQPLYHIYSFYEKQVQLI